jgi:hypothetical protein
LSNFSPGLFQHQVSFMSAAAAVFIVLPTFAVLLGDLRKKDFTRLRNRGIGPRGLLKLRLSVIKIDRNMILSGAAYSHDETAATLLRWGLNYLFKLLR